MPEISKNKKTAAFIKIMESPWFSEHYRFQYREITEPEDFNSFMGNTVCSYISNSGLWENHNNASIVVGAKNNGSFRAEIWHYIAGMDYAGTSEVLCFKDDLTLDEAIAFADKAPYCFCWVFCWKDAKEKLLEQFDLIPRPGKIFSESGRCKYLPFDKKIPDSHKGVTFDNNANPAFGWAVILFGAPLSGKAIIADNLLLINAEIINIDELYSIYSNLAKIIKKDDPEYQNGNAIFNKENKESRLHLEAYRWYWSSMREGLIFNKNNINQELLPNIIVDITGNRDGLIGEAVDILKAMGYKVSFVLTLVQPQTAFLNNLKLEKMLPCDMLDEELWHSQCPIVKRMCDIKAEQIEEAWIILNGQISGAFRRNLPETADFINKNRVIKLEKSSPDRFDFSRELENYLSDYLKGQHSYKPFEGAEIISFKNMPELSRIIKAKYGNIGHFEKQFMQENIYLSFERIYSHFLE